MATTPRNRQSHSVLPATQGDLSFREEKKRGGTLRLNSSLAKTTALLCLAYAAFISCSSTSTPNAKTDSVPIFTCPSEDTTTKAKNYAGTWAEDTYKGSTERIKQNITLFLEGLETNEFDAWGLPYHKVKSMYAPFKIKYFAPYLNSGSSIYESASGVGLNLLLTLENLQEHVKLDNITVYGTEYVASSATLSNIILDARLPLLQNISATRGNLCQGDSANLPFVPSNSMDLVFTGYITPLFDPLSLGNAYDYRQTCFNLTETAKMQEAQEEWYSTWVKEMIRIAKPGSPVIIEQASSPLCESHNDYGGVSKDYWSRAIEQFQWDADPSSLVLEEEPMFEKRWNVFMLKKGDSNVVATK